MLEENTNNQIARKSKSKRSFWTQVFLIESVAISLFACYMLLEGYTNLPLPPYFRYADVVDAISVLCGLFGVHQFIVALIKVFKTPSSSMKAYVGCSIIYISFFLALIFRGPRVLNFLPQDLQILVFLSIPFVLTWWFTRHQIKYSQQANSSNVDQEDILDFFD